MFNTGQIEWYIMQCSEYLHSSCKKLRRLSGHRSHFNCCIHALLTLQAKSTSSIAWARICWRRHSKVTMAASLRMDRQVKKIHWSKDDIKRGIFMTKKLIADRAFLPRLMFYDMVPWKKREGNQVAHLHPLYPHKHSGKTSIFILWGKHASHGELEIQKVNVCCTNIYIIIQSL